MNPINKAVRDRINRIIVERCNGYQNEMIKDLGFSQSTISAWCCGTRLPNAAAIVAICDMYGCSADWLLGLKGSVDEIE